MKVIKRDGTTEHISFDKVLRRLSKLGEDLDISTDEIAQKVCSRIYDGVKTSELDELSAQLCSSMLIEHEDYGTLSSRLIISNHHKNTSPSFSETIHILYNNKDIHNVANPLISDDVYNIVMNNREKLNNFIKYERDFNFDYFGFKTLERSYLLKVNDKVIERPQHLYMRVALGIHGKDFKDALETYDYLSKQYFIHATPTLFNAGTCKPQLSSCFLLDSGDSIEDIFDLAKECAIISKNSGGIGINIHDIRAKNSPIRGTHGKSDGIIPMLRVFNNIARYVNQCFTPTTIIYTEQGPKMISEINTDDKVITIDGSFKKVNEVIENKINKNILEIRTSCSFEPISVTKEHELYVLKGQKKILKFSTIKNRLTKNIIKPEFVLASEINEDDIVAYPLINDTNDQIIDSMLEYYRMIGIMLGDGHIRNNKYNEFGITVNKNSKIKTYNFIKQYLEKNTINYWETEANNCVQFRWSKTSKFDVERIDIYDDESEKYINSKFMTLNKDYTLRLIQGLLETDGSNLKELYFYTTSYKLAHGIRYLLMKTGVLTSGCVKDNRGKTHEIREGEYITNKKISYSIRIPKHEILNEIIDFKKSQFLKYFTYNGMMWSRIKYIKEIPYEGNVYDLNIEENHNYLVGSFGMVHNSGKRKGSIAVYIEPWHADILEFLELRKNHGNEEERCRDLFLALWIPDLFMKRVTEGGMWSLMCPDECRNLSTTYGDEFEELYTNYEKNGKYRKQVKAQDVWLKIIESQIETGTPYMLYKDAVNKKSNQKNLGTIKSSNLCIEVTQYTNYKDEIAVCNLGSICLPKYINDDLTFNHEELHKIAKILTKNLNKVIDVNFYPLEKARTSNMRHRPVGIGIQGISDLFAVLKIAFDSAEARKLNKDIFETIYHGAIEASMEIAKKRKQWYESSTYNEEYMKTYNPDTNDNTETPDEISKESKNDTRREESCLENISVLIHHS